MQKRYDQNPCPNCGQPKRKAADLCASCRVELRRVGAKGRRGAACEDCGSPIADKGGTAKRCWTCWSRHRHSRLKEPCMVAGCPRPHRAKGYCIEHYQRFVQSPANRTGAGRKLIDVVRAQPCQLCGYDRLSSHAHRLTGGKDGGVYAWGNVVALCARCHEEVHRGLTEPPLPLILSNVYAHPLSSSGSSG